MRRTYVLLALVLIASGYILKTRFLGSQHALDAAKDRIRHIDQQPAARQEAPRPQRQVNTERQAPLAPPAQEAPRQQADQAEEAPGSSERAVHLVKGTFSLVDGTVVYSADAQLDIGHGIMVSSPTGVMVSDAELRHISGDLLVERPESTATMQNAFLTVEGNHVEITSDTAEIVKKEEAKQP